MNSLEAAGSKRSLMSWRGWKGKRRTKEKCCHVFHVRYPVKKISRWEETGFEKEKKQVYCTIRIIFYILIILPFYFLLQVSCFFNHPCYCTGGREQSGVCLCKTMGWVYVLMWYPHCTFFYLLPLCHSYAQFLYEIHVNT